MRFKLAGVAAVVFLAAGCSAQQPANTEGADYRVNPRSVIIRPQAYERDTYAIQLAARRLMIRCMARKGYSYKGPFIALEYAPGLLTPDLDFRRKHGYSIRPTPGREDPGSDTEAWDAAMRGKSNREVSVSTPLGQVASPADGCVGEAREEVAGSVTDYVLATAVAEDYFALADAQINSRPEWRAITSDWHSCMTAKGHPYKTPGEAVAAFRQEEPVTAKSEVLDESRVALDDGTCQLEVGMPSVLRKLREGHYLQLSGAARQDLGAAAQARSVAVRNSREILEWPPLSPDGKHSQ